MESEFVPYQQVLEPISELKWWIRKGLFKTYEEAQIECIMDLISIIKNQKKMSKQTAVEWLQERLLLSLSDELKSLNGFFVIAKEMEKEQIVDAFGEGNKYNGWALQHEPEEYYNKTFKQQHDS
jgi:hypothetical protein